MGAYALLDLREPVSAWTHGAWMLLAIPATCFLWRRSGGDRAKGLSLLVFGISLMVCFAASALFHGVRGPSERIAGFDLIDHIGIFILIAGSYTPLAWNLLEGRWRWGYLALAWLGAGLGAGLLLACGSLSTPLATAMYLTLGWGAIFCYIELGRRLSYRTLRPLVLGGVLYSVGAALNVLEWPTIDPVYFRAHEVFHLFVMAGSLAHYQFMLKVVIPNSAPAPPRPASTPEAARVVLSGALDRLPPVRALETILPRHRPT